MSELFKNHFLQLHLLTSYPPANLNRDDLGRPKTAFMGGALRLRVSSQSLKRAWRTSGIFESALSGNLGVRTKEKGVEIYNNLKEKGVSEKNAISWAKSIAGVFGKPKKADTNNPLRELELEQLVHIGPEEKNEIDRLVSTIIDRDSGPREEELNLLRKNTGAADIALFGRMLADNTKFNVEAAAQVAHALAVHRCQIEEDFFTAVDDLNKGEEDSGAAHLGETEFGAAVFYMYVCIDRQLLLENLNGDKELAKSALNALVQSACTVAPTGKQNSFASRAYASYVLVEKGDQQPRSLSVSFLNAIQGESILEKAIDTLNENMEKMDQVYGSCADSRLTMNALTGKGSLFDIKNFAIEG